MKGSDGGEIWSLHFCFKDGKAALCQLLLFSSNNKAAFLYEIKAVSLRWRLDWRMISDGRIEQHTFGVIVKRSSTRSGSILNSRSVKGAEAVVGVDIPDEATIPGTLIVGLRWGLD